MSEPIDRRALVAHVGQVHSALVALTEAVGGLHRFLAAAQNIQLSESDCEQDVQLSETDEQGVLQQLWRKHGAGRTELAGIQVDQAQLRQHLVCLAHRLDSGARDSLVEAARETDISWQPPHDDDEVERALVGIDDGQAGAVRTILYLAQHNTVLGRIDLSTGSRGTWLVPFGPEDYPSYKQGMLDALRSLRGAVNPDERQDAVVWLDQWLRLLIPVERRTGGQLRIVPPAPDSTWAQALKCSFQAVERIGVQASPPFVVGIPPADSTIGEAEKSHYTERTESRVQDVDLEHDGKVLWRLCAWTGRQTSDRTPNLLNKAKVVYGKAQQDTSALSAG